MDELELREYVFSLVKKHGAKEAKRILFDEAENGDNFDLIIAAAKYGHAVVKAIFEAETSMIN
ncbi:hypothetical protein KAR91_45760 [Candidatus Pacearchaeota archaeon]|nr:hypothetical protein [Candidatus Pacearchaeota archaeon]